MHPPTPPSRDRIPIKVDLLSAPRRRVPPFLAPVIHDHWMWVLLIVALVVNLGLFGFLLIQFASLPPLVPLHFDTLGQPDRIEARDGLFTLAQIGLIVIMVNIGLGALFYRRERLAAYLLSGASIIIQLLLWFAAIQIVRVVSS